MKIIETHHIQPEMDAYYNCQDCVHVDTDDMVQCDTCNGWYHYSCAGSNITHEIANYPWDCKRCVVDQFRLTLTKECSTSKLAPQNASVATRTITYANQESQKNLKDKQSLSLEYVEAQKRLEEEQLNKTF